MPRLPTNFGLLDAPDSEYATSRVAVLPEAFDMHGAMQELQAECAEHMRAGKFLVTLGGEHSLTIAPVRAAREVFGSVGVVQFDAHSDLRADFEGTPYSHASVMRRVHE